MRVDERGLFADLWPMAGESETPYHGHVAPSAQASFPSPTDAIDVSDVSAGYDGHPALEHVNLRVPEGCLAGLLGPNGSGKSTLLRVLVGLLKPWSGEVRVLGRHPTEARPFIGYVPQVHGGAPRFPITVADAVAMGLYRRGQLWPKRSRARVRAVLERVGLEGFGGRLVHTLSGGQQRRVLIARALVRDPKVLLLDEPTAGLDAPSEATLLALLRELADEGRTVLVATHDLAGVRESFDLAALLNRRVVAVGRPEDVMLGEALDAAFGRELLQLQGAGHHHVRHHGGGGR